MRASLLPALLLTFLSKPDVCCQESFKIMFYNVENLFDTRDDSLTDDDNFTPAGALHWTKGRLSDKLNKISKVILAAGEWQPPAIIGMCEIENRQVLNELVFNTPLSKFSYKIIHGDSPDERGIDVALIHDSKRVRISHFSLIRVSGNGLLTRDILYARSIIQSDTFHVFINHWPSRSSGQLETEEYRMTAAKVLRYAVDSVLTKSPLAKIIIMGDFNDDPENESLVKGLRSQTVQGDYEAGILYNLSSSPKGSVNGTLKYLGNWNLFDQMIVSGSLLNNPGGWHINPDCYKIFYNSFMLETDEMYNGVKPFRTYNGYRYKGGFSDHLPVLIELTRFSDR
ncbi:MAG TPA: endonuclease [Bacteroidales bacterium]|nr:endonuclease [Bacteroidales bacterium]